MANGGVVPSRNIGSGISIGEKIGRYISNAFSIALESSAAKVLQNLNQELNLEGGAPSGVSPGDGGDVSGDAGDFSGNTSAIKAFNYFKSQGYTAFQAAAIVGNLLQENRAMNPTLTNSIGRKGIAQWDGNRWSRLESFASKNGLNPNTLEAQLQFIHHEIKTGGGGMSIQSFKATKTLEEATVLFREKYERPGAAEANDSNRIKFARSVLQTSAGGPSLSAKGVRKFSKANITSLFGQQEGFRSKPHEGMDIAAPQGTPISFGMGGEVIGVYRTNSTSRDANGGYGNYMDVKFSDGKIARIAHLSNIPTSIQTGKSFKANQIIAYSGGEEGAPGSGRSGGPHIHLEQLSKPMGIQETTKGKYDPMKGGLFQRIQSGGTKVSVAPSQKSQDIASLQEKPQYSLIVNNTIAFVPLVPETVSS
jgi:murein DD-endopeptidase MepM/ murein hydrolase activator NlpD